MDIIDRRIDKAKKLLKTNDKKYVQELEVLEKLKASLDDGKPASSVDFTDEEREFLKDLALITLKPVIYAANVAEDAFSEGLSNNEYVNQVQKYAQETNSEFMPISAKIEEDIAQFSDEEKKSFLDDLNISSSGLDRLIQSSYRLLGLISYLTAGEPEVRAWTIIKGTKAPQAAGKIHSDFERGFIRAEVVSFNDLIECGTHAAAKEKGLVRSEGKEYVMQDGDIVLFRFNV